MYIFIYYFFFLGTVTPIIKQEECEEIFYEQEALNIKQTEVKQDKMKIKRIESDRLKKWQEDQKILLEKKGYILFTDYNSTIFNII